VNVQQLLKECLNILDQYEKQVETKESKFAYRKATIATIVSIALRVVMIKDLDQGIK
jgi:hypothetical protein